MPGKVTLREVQTGDLPVFFEHQRDPEALRMADFPTRDLVAFTQHWEKVMRNETALNRTVLFDGQVAGYIARWEQAGETLVGYWLGREFWGKGIATRALGLLLEQTGTRPLHARVARHNVGSIRVLEKCGFEMVGEDPAAGEEAGDEAEEFLLRLESDGKGKAK
jgi:RimJ/RimL family protein N-acetyltransferase